MSMLSRWDPFREMWNVRRMMDSVFDSAFDRQFDNWGGENWGLALDVVENDDAFTVKASIPGINPDDLDITFTDNVLTIQGELKKDEEVEESRYHLRERRYGRFQRSLRLPTQVSGDQIKAKYVNGELTLTLPKAEEVKPKRIAIESGSSGKMIEGKLKNIAHKN